MRAPHTSPLTRAPEITADDGDRVRAEYTVEAAEPLLRGHYPGFPIFPGVCLLDCVLQTAAAHRPGLRLHRIASTRFTAPVYPGQRLAIDLRWRAEGPRWHGRATVAGDRGTAATAHLVFEPEQ